MTFRFGAGILAFALSGCASRSAVHGPSSGNDSGEDRAPPAAVVGGQAVPRGDLVDFWFLRGREAYVATLEDLVDERIAREQGRAFGIVVPPVILDRAVEDEVKARQEQLAAAYGAAADLAGAVREGYGMDVSAWREKVLRPRLGAQLLLQRVVRMDARRRGEILVRVIVSEDRDRALRVREKVAAGADFALTALHESKDPSARSGGALPKIARGDLAWPEVERRLFEAPVGAVLGPWEVRGGGAPGPVSQRLSQWHLYKVVLRSDPWPAGDPASAARLEQDLQGRRPDLAELATWRRRVRRERGVRFFAPDGTTFSPPPR